MNKKNIISLLVLAILAVAIPLGLNLARQQQTLKSSATEAPIAFSGDNAEQRNGAWVVKDRTKPVIVTFTSPLGSPGVGVGSTGPTILRSVSNPFKAIMSLLLKGLVPEVLALQTQGVIFQSVVPVVTADDWVQMHRSFGKWLALKPKITLQLTSDGPPSQPGILPTTVTTNLLRWLSFLTKLPENLVRTVYAQIGVGPSPSAPPSGAIFQSAVSSDVTAEQIVAEMRVALGGSYWDTRENHAKLRNIAYKHFGYKGSWLTPEQAWKLGQARPDIGRYFNLSGPNDLNAPHRAIQDWIPGGALDTDAIGKLLDIVRADNGKSIGTGDYGANQVLAMLGIKERMIDELGGPEGSREWPSTRFLRMRFSDNARIGYQDRWLTWGQCVMSQMPGQEGFSPPPGSGGGCNAQSSPAPSPTPAASTTKECDFNGSGGYEDMDITDFWKDSFLGLPTSQARDPDCNHDGNIDLLDFNKWRNLRWHGSEGS